MVGPYPATLRQRRRPIDEHPEIIQNENNPNDVHQSVQQLPPPPQQTLADPPQTPNPFRFGTHSHTEAAGVVMNERDRFRGVRRVRTSHIYCMISFVIAFLAVITSSPPSSPVPPATPPVVKSEYGGSRPLSASSVSEIAKAAALSIVGSDSTALPASSIEETVTTSPPRPSLLRSWIQTLHNTVASIPLPRGSPSSYPPLSTLLSRMVDPSLLPPSPTTLPSILDKILTSTPRLLTIANLLLSCTYLLHSYIANLFLSPHNAHRRYNGRERLGGFLVFKLLLISAVVEPDTLDLLILLSWYTVMAFLRSLAHLAASTTAHTSQSGLPPRRGVLRLLTCVFFANVTAASACAALFHGAGWGMVVLLTCDCALLAVDVAIHGCQHAVQVLEERRYVRESEGEEENREAVRHGRRVGILEGTVFGLELLGCGLTIGHFLHIWYLHGLGVGLVDGVLALHLHTAVSLACKKIAERRNIHKIARDLDSLFTTATELERQKASANADVCCICLTTLSIGHVKKVGCGHLYHSTCLREVVERARSIEAAKCPLCRAGVLDGRQQECVTVVAPVVPVPPPPPPVINEGVGMVREHALFRFSTEGILPAWLPLPAFSFEIVRRPNPEAAVAPVVPQPPAAGVVQTAVQRRENNAPGPGFWRRLLLFAGAIPMSPEEEASALDQLVDMFPQYDRGDLRRELRDRGSAEAVVDGILMGGLLERRLGVVVAETGGD